MAENTLYYGDNVDVLRRYITDESIDLIYLDPPFQSGKSYNVLFEEKNGSASTAQIKAFEDTWHWDRRSEETYVEIVEKVPNKRLADLIRAFREALGSNDVMAYLVMMAIRLVELHRVLKKTGSLYLHCDTTASHYLKLILDAIFGNKNFQNEIIWCYKTGGATQKRFGRKHDTIFFYTKSNRWTFNPEKEKSYMMHEYGFKKSNFQKDEKGQYSWVIAKDWWEIPAIGSATKERLGYPTQKPEALLEKIIKASSTEGDIILDPFCGCGTTIAVAQRLKRRWIGIDITHLAINLIRRRLKDAFGEEVKYKVIGEPEDVKGAEVLAREDRYQFQWWALGLVGARPVDDEKRKGADKGIDGYIYFHDETKKTKSVILQVKSGHVGVRDIRDLIGVINREKAQIGVFITLEKATRDMIKEAVSAGYYRSPGWKKDYPKIQILTIEDLLRGKRIDYPPANITFRTAEKAKKGIQEEMF